jgi:hypothetical protein
LTKQPAPSGSTAGGEKKELGAVVAMQRSHRSSGSLCKKQTFDWLRNVIANSTGSLPVAAPHEYEADRSRFPARWDTSPLYCAQVCPVV